VSPSETADLPAAPQESEAAADAGDADGVKGDKPIIEITMESGGTIVVELDPEAAPVTVANFLKLVNEGFYDGLTFHRIIPNFMIQGGDPTGTGAGGSEEYIKGEFSANGVDNPISHARGVISMARAQDPDSARSQFFITNTDRPDLDGGYAAFGTVVSGLDVIDEISAVPTDSKDRPLEPVVIKTIKEIK
jgi:peptidyl-prolyl cis-trans isomerase B (cyclophilin B)